MYSASIDPREPEPRNGRGLGAIALALAVACLVVGLCGGCSPKVIQGGWQRDTVFVGRVQVDSVAVRDSVYVREKGDTVYMYREKVRDRYQYLRDTVRVVRVDSVAVERVQYVEVSKPLSKAENAKIGAFWWLCGAVALLLAWMFRKPLLKLIKV